MWDKLGRRTRKEVRVNLGYIVGGTLKTHKQKTVSIEGGANCLACIKT